ncbi:MAG: hypothetical protein LBT00_08555 [Spirochaetaceae bacterium]|nr:hypothetical protein [Spirochaetaceae bacterium]
MRFQIERSPFSEDITFIDDDYTWVVDSGGAASVEFEFAFLNGEAADTDFDYTLVSLGAGVGVVVRGIFDSSTERDEGNKAARTKPRVIVFGWPKAARAGTRLIVRDREYTAASFERDANLGMVVWLR